MSRQLPADCLNEIFEYLEQDKITLHSCLLVSWLWCEIAVRILWKNLWNVQYRVQYKPYRTHVPLGIISTLIACLPNESKDLLYQNGLFISTPPWKPTMFNYASFCKILSIHGIDKMIQHFLEKRKFIVNKYLLSQEILKMFMNEISSLKYLDYHSGYFTYSIVTKNCLMNLIELNCNSNINSEFFYQASQICHNIRSLTINFGETISNGLADLISLQNNLKSVTLQYFQCEDDIETITSSLPSTLTKLKIKESYIPLSFIAKFTNLQEIIFSLKYYSGGFDYFYQLQDVTFPHLRILKFLYEFPAIDSLIKFLKINGENLKELYVWDNNDSLNLAIAKFCPNLKTLFTIFINNEKKTLKEILISCQHLESINIWCGEGYLNENEFLKILTRYSSENFSNLEMYYVYDERSKILPIELEEFFINWKYYKPQNSLSFNIIKDYDKSVSLEVNEENMKIIERYIEMGIIKKFLIKKYEEET